MKVRERKSEHKSAISKHFNFADWFVWCAFCSWSERPWPQCQRTFRLVLASLSATSLHPCMRASRSHPLARKHASCPPEARLHHGRSSDSARPSHTGRASPHTPSLVCPAGLATPSCRRGLSSLVHPSSTLAAGPLPTFALLTGLPLPCPMNGRGSG